MWWWPPITLVMKGYENTLPLAAFWAPCRWMVRRWCPELWLDVLKYWCGNTCGEVKAAISPADGLFLQCKTAPQLLGRAGNSWLYGCTWSDWLYCLWLCVCTAAMCTHRYTDLFVKYVWCSAGLYAWNASLSYHVESHAGLSKQLWAVTEQSSACVATTHVLISNQSLSDICPRAVPADEEL